MTPAHYIEAIDLLLRLGMKWESKKRKLWLDTPNPNLGGASPTGLIFMERGHKVLRFVVSSLDENLPPEKVEDLLK